MNPVLMLFAAVLMVAQLVLPRRFAFVPLMVAVSQFQSAPVIQVGVSFTTWKLVILAGLFRAMRERTFSFSLRQPLDLLIALWSGWIILSGFAHHPTDHNPITIRLSMIFDFAGSYLYARSFIQDRDDILRFAKCLALVMLPLAFEAIAEKAMHKNFYTMIAGTEQWVEIRGGRVRAAGPFSHPILLGTFAATSMILLGSLWYEDRRRMLVGAGACAVVVLCSGSSGPIMTIFTGLMAIGLWRWRERLGLIRKCAIAGLIALQLVMHAPVWYLMSRIDLAGGSTGWYRAALIDTVVDHLSEWWLVGSDYTRHWLGSGVYWSKDQIDITNYYVGMGVTGGLLLLLLFLAILFRAFQLLGRGMTQLRLASDRDEFILWCVGASLFAHCFAFVSVNYFDQSNAALSLVLGTVPGLCGWSMARGAASAEAPCQEEANDPASMVSQECSDPCA